MGAGGATVRVVVGDDDDAMLSAMCVVLEDDPRIELVGRSSTGSGARDLAIETGADVVVLDVRLPDGGEPTAQAIVDLTPPPVVVAVSALVDRGTVLSMLKAGASCYLAKDRIGTSLSEVVVRASRGEVVLAVGSAQRLVADLTR
jgi:DNA-binding NarL/FixJ family response regulator